MKTFKTIDAALKYIELQIPINLEKIGEELRDVLRNNVRLLWYGRGYTPTHYTRTYELIDSLSVTKAKKVGNAWEVMIYFDTDKIHPYPAENGEWSKHQSITNGQNVAEWIPYWTNFGQDSPLFSYDGVGFLEETLRWESDDKYVRNRMKELLEDKGFTCI